MRVACRTQLVPGALEVATDRVHREPKDDGAFPYGLALGDPLQSLAFPGRKCRGFGLVSFKTQDHLVHVECQNLEVAHVVLAQSCASLDR